MSTFYFKPSDFTLCKSSKRKTAKSSSLRHNFPNKILLIFNTFIIITFHLPNYVLSFNNSTDISSSDTKVSLKSLETSLKDLQTELEVLQKRLTLLENQSLNQTFDYQLELLRIKTIYESRDKSRSLFTAIDSRKLDIVKLLTGINVDLNQRNNHSETALTRAASTRHDKGGSLPIIQFLIENGANPFLNDKDGYNFLHRLVDEDENDFANNANGNGNGLGLKLTPNQFHNLVTFLAERALTNLFNTPGTFIKKIGTPRYKWIEDLKSISPLMLAVKNMEVNPETLQLLQNNEVNFGGITKNAHNIYSYAIFGQRSRTFLETIANLSLLHINPRNDYHHEGFRKWNLLHYATVCGTLEQVEFFLHRLKFGVNKVTDDPFGNSPLHLVSRHQTEKIYEFVKLLVENGANVTVKNKFGKLAEDIVSENYDLREYQKEVVIKLLNKYR